MLFLSMVKADESRPIGPPPAELFQRMAEFEQEGRLNGTLVDSRGLLPSSAGAIVSYADGKTSILDGPFTEAKEIVGGYAVLDVRSRDQALEVARRLLRLHNEAWPAWEGEIELRQIAEY